MLTSMLFGQATVWLIYIQLPTKSASARRDQQLNSQQQKSKSPPKSEAAK